METLTLRPTAADAGIRVDAWLAGQIGRLTRSAVQRLLEEGRVTLDGRPPAKNCRLTGAEVLTVSLPDPGPNARSTTAAAPSPAWAGPCAPASSTASTGTPPA